MEVSENLDSTSNDAQSAAAQCPVPHAPSQPLPPGHPPTANGIASTLKPPTDPRCVFFRTYEDLSQTPPLSRAQSMQLDDVKKLAEARLQPEQMTSIDPNSTFVLASRNSQLALIQTSQVSAMLTAHFGKASPAFLGAISQQDNRISPPVSPPPNYDSKLIEQFKEKTNAIGLQSPVSFPFTSMSTGGDKNHTSPLYVIGGEGKAIWTKELEVALAAGAVDAIVHCLKDIPTTLPEGMMLGAILERGDPRDALIVKQGLPYKTLDELPPGSVIGTSSIRRVAQLRRRYPDLVFSDVRGNLNTRFAKLDNPTGPYTALVLAAAGLIRLGVGKRITAFLSAPTMMYAVGQGSLTIEVRKPKSENDRDAKILAMVQAIGDWRSTWRQEAERSLLRELEGGCSIPIGVDCRFDDHDEIEGKRNEKSSGFDQEFIFENGHTIPIDKDDIDEPPPLKRLATESNKDDFIHSKNHANVAPASGAHNDTVDSRIFPEDRATEPKEGKDLYLKLSAMVVSLDGLRHSEYSLRSKVRNVQDARQLGIDVAHELATKRGAREILNEVERHRKLAEEADDRRRQAEKEKRREREKVIDEIVSSENIESDEERESRRKLEELLKNSVKLPATVGGSIEIDRRGIPRDDGQLKAWEV